jgi:hypothetical protein
MRVYPGTGKAVGGVAVAVAVAVVEAMVVVVVVVSCGGSGLEAGDAAAGVA